jgi:hypothetical protein
MVATSRSNAGSYSRFLTPPALPPSLLRLCVNYMILTLVAALNPAPVA